MGRSLKVKLDFLQTVKSAVRRNGYPRQKDLAEDLQMSLATISNYLNGRPVDTLNFQEISDRLGLDWQDLADFSDPVPPFLRGVRGDRSNEEISNPTNPTHQIPTVVLPELEEERLVYVERFPVESACYQQLLTPGALVRVKAPNFMGKTALIARMSKKIICQEGYRTVYINFHLAQQTDFSNIDRFLKWFCISVGQALGLKNRLEDYWDEEYSTSKVDCTDYFEKYLLAQADSPLLLCLDEVDRIFPHQEIASEFLGLLRAWHEQAKTRPVWQKLRLLLAHSTEVYIRLDIDSSPFNVGLPLELPEFEASQVQELAQLHGLEIQENELQLLIEQVGGHPYLIEQAFSSLRLRGRHSLAELLAMSTTDSGIYSNYLRHLWRLLQKKPQLSAALKKVFQNPSGVQLNPQESYKLNSMGLVRVQGDNVTIRCNLYKEYFKNKF